MGSKTREHVKAGRGGRVRGLALGALVLAAAACGDDDGPTRPPVQQVPEVGRIELTPDTVRLLAGQSQQLTATLFGTTGTPVANVPATWAAADPAVVRVGSAGLVEALAPGQTAVTITAGGKQAQTLVGVGLTGTYTLRLANGQPVPGVLAQLPNCPPSPGPEPGPNPRQYRVDGGFVQFKSADLVDAQLQVHESCPYSSSTYYSGTATGGYDVVQGTVRWRTSRVTRARLPFGNAQLRGDSLVLSWKPDLGDSIRFHFVRQ